MMCVTVTNLDKIRNERIGPKGKRKVGEIAKEFSGKEVEVVWAYAEEKRGALRRKEGDESRLRLREKEERNTYNRRWLRISWTEHVTNEEVFNRANTKPTLLDGLLKRRLAYHGHLVRKDGITLDLMIGRLHGTRPRGRPRTTWLKDLATQANISYKEAITIPRDRKTWRSVGNPRRTPDE